MAAGHLQIERGDGMLTITVQGAWVIDHARSLAAQVDAAREGLAGERHVRINGDQVERLDTTGAWLLQKVIRSARGRTSSVTVEGLSPDSFTVVDQLHGLEEGGEHCEGVRCYTLADQLIGIGRGLHRGLTHLLDATAFIGRTFVTTLRCAGRPARMRLPAIIANMHRAGINAIPIVALLSFLVAIVMAYQGATELKRFGAEIFTVQLTAVSLLREMGVLITAILVAGRSGSAMAAEIGMMKVREEVDAMQTMGLDPFEVLVLPRVIALVIMVPLLTLVADFAGLAGAAFSVGIILDLPLQAYLANAGEALTPWNFWSGMIKAPVFAFLIGTTATFWGMQAEGSAENVGRLTTMSVVQGIFLVIVADTVFSLVYIQLGL